MAKTKQAAPFSMSMFDAKGRANKGATLHLINPVTGEPAFNGETPVTITLLGKQSDAHIDFVNAQVRDIRKEAAKNPKAKPKKKDDEYDLRESIEELADKLAKMTVDWTGLEADGQKIPLDHESKKRVYIDYFDIREQVNEFFEDKDGVNFIKG